MLYIILDYFGNVLSDDGLSDYKFKSQNKKRIKKFVVFRVRHRNTTFYYVFTTLKLSVIRSPAHGFANMLADIRGESCPHIGGKVCENYFCR